MTVVDQSTLPLSVAMREGSRAEHRDAEDSAFMAELLAGRMNAQGYVDYLRRLRTVYATMESAIRGCRRDPMVAAVHDPMLERLTALDADLAFWAPGWSPGGDHTLDSRAVDAYLTRLEAACDWGGLLVAHHYTRYLGDLSGGQAIGRILERTFDLDGRGVAFYAFPEIPKPKPYKDAYRARLDSLHLSVVDQARVVAEVKIAFGLNQALFAELDR